MVSFSGLTAKITVPFVALFALVLLVLGAAITRDILTEVESRVESEQQIVLKFTMLSPFDYTEESLRAVRDRARVTQTEFVVIEDGRILQSTFSRQDAAAWKTADALRQTVELQPELYRRESGVSVPPTVEDLKGVGTPEGARRDDEIVRRHLVLNNAKWLVLYGYRPTSKARRHFYLLYPYAEIEQAQKGALMRVVGLGGGGLVLVAVLGLIVAQWIARPVRKLAAAAKRISAGGLDSQDVAPLAQSSIATDEIGELTDAFRTMVESLRASHAELLKAERLAVTGKLAASVAHEIRNPLTSLRMTVETLMSRSNADAATLEAYRIILGEIDRLALAVEELLTFARPRPPRREPVDLNKLVTDTLKFLERQMAHARVKAVAELDPTLTAVSLDPNKIRQLLVNLLLNAQQAIIRDGTVTVTTRRGEGENGRGGDNSNGAALPAQSSIVLSVSDTGPGIAEEVRGKLFEIFVTTKPGGGGLGLAIAKQIAEEHGGSIGYETSPKGTTFTVVLPIKATEQPSAEPIRGLAPASRSPS